MKRFTLTKDSQGWAAWPEEAKLNINDEEVFDENCEIRGIETFYVLLDELEFIHSSFNEEKKEYKLGIIEEFVIMTKDEYDDLINKKENDAS